jgi:dipeptidyl aminopeptidase/acylaminoacyl peptidase
LADVIPNAYNISIPSRSRDGNTMTVLNTGPRDPGTYYMLKDGKIEAAGSRQPLLESANLADLKYITYKSRDGLKIPAFLTVPNGEPPYPLIVLPHGGPFVQETVIYDEWAQMLANNGFLVLQPQYRGSHGYGEEFYKIAFNQGGQGGYKMQDDKDDGALYLVEQGLADPDRMAMFGWSYGGYAALVAASRTPQIYQCVIAGAAVSDPNMQVNYYRFELRGTPALEQINMWDDSISPIKEVEKVNVPMLLIHGDVDQRVPLDHAKKYRKLLDKYNKNYKYVELEGADHFSSTLFFDHQIELYESMIDFLENDCGTMSLQAKVAAEADNR